MQSGAAGSGTGADDSPGMRARTMLRVAGARRQEVVMQALRELFRFAGQVLWYAGQFLLSVLRLFRLARRIKANTSAWQELPGQSTPVTRGAAGR